MRGRVRAVSGYHADALSAGWEFASATPGTIEDASALQSHDLEWRSAVVPSTVASSLRDAGAWSLDDAPRRFDAEDWWYRTRFAAPRTEVGEEHWCCFDGLATVADVWLNGTLIVSSTNMFHAHECRVDDHLRAENELVIRFRALDALLGERRSRPRWRAPMVENQQLRWFRTTLLGRTPGWSPPAAAVGPWRAIRLEHRRGVTIGDVRLRADADGRLDVECNAACVGEGTTDSAVIVVARDGRTHRTALTVRNGRVTGQIVVPDVERWWPHTHGDPALYAVRLIVTHSGGVTEADLGAVGFRSTKVDTTNGDFAITVNGVKVFCRGACWTPLDAVSFSATREALEAAFDQVTQAGMNMLRVSGAMVYEDDEFLDACDSRGVLLWQDMMFANMDYPEDEEFKASASAEARQLLERLQARPCVTVVCGNSEGEQQAAMWGAPRDRWQPALFHELLARIATEICPDVQYWPSSAHGGAFPHQADSGTTSYYGVGAYLRPLEDARRAEVRFASECLAFANVPDSRLTDLLPGSAEWKSRTPRDLGAAWDFEGVRDHYLAHLYRVDPAALLASDPERYLAVSRVATGEVMAAVFGEWRRARSATRGGLVWFLRDLWAGAGWGVVDANGTPKAAWHHLRRALAPVAISLSDEGGNGIGVHVVNDTALPVRGSIELMLFREGEVRVGRGSLDVSIKPRGAIELNAAAAFDDFCDLSHAYRFGPASHDVMIATLRDEAGARMADAFHFPVGLPSGRATNLELTATACARPDGTAELVIYARRFAQSVHVDVEGFVADDDYFHVAPGMERRVLLRPSTGASALTTGTVCALNAWSPVPVVVMNAGS